MQSCVATETFEMRKSLLTLFLEKPRGKAETILETYELFINTNKPYSFSQLNSPSVSKPPQVEVLPVTFS